jgi:hypothetical protein
VAAAFQSMGDCTDGSAGPGGSSCCGEFGVAGVRGLDWGWLARVVGVAVFTGDTGRGSLRSSGQMLTY